VIRKHCPTFTQNCHFKTIKNMFCKAYGKGHNIHEMVAEDNPLWELFKGQLLAVAGVISSVPSETAVHVKWMLSVVM